MDADTGVITQLLQQIRDGDCEAQEKLVPLVYSQLRQLASYHMRGERPDHTLETTALVHEAFLRLLGDGAQMEWQNRSHFFAVASKQMRRILVDYARAANAHKRDGKLRRISLESAIVFAEEQSEEILALDEALDRLATLDPRQCRIVEMRFFGGLGSQEIANLLRISRRTVNRDWLMARAWLYSELTKRIERDAGALEPHQRVI